MRTVLCWVADRMKEPSSYAAAGGAVVGVGVLVDQPIVIVVGVVGGALGWFLKEKGEI
jgi:4-amino-4-deoxy-L-arabinose transferase-like glycosyltransferase